MSSDACRVNATLQQFADAALQKERSSNENRTPGQTEPKLSVWQSLARSLSKTSKKANFPELAGALPAEQDTMDACEVLDECEGRDTGASHARSEHTADGPQLALPHSEVEVCLAEEAADEVAEGTVMHDTRWPHKLTVKEVHCPVTHLFTYSTKCQLPPSVLHIKLKLIMMSSKPCVHESI